MMNYSHIQINYHNTKGFNLIEVLIAMIIIAVGVLGIAALQFQGLKYNHDAYLRSQINVLANDIIDRMRLNSANLGPYNNIKHKVPTTTTTSTCSFTSAPGAANDLNCWYDLLNMTLPPGSIAEIKNDTTNSNLYTVTFSWTSSAESSATTVSYTFQP